MRVRYGTRAVCLEVGCRLRKHVPKAWHAPTGCPSAGWRYASRLSLARGAVACVVVGQLGVAVVVLVIARGLEIVTLHRGHAQARVGAVGFRVLVRDRRHAPAGALLPGGRGPQRVSVHRGPKGGRVGESRRGSFPANKRLQNLNTLCPLLLALTRESNKR